MFTKNEKVPYKFALEGVSFKTIVWGKKTLLGEFKLLKGCSVPIHKHFHEQTGYLVKGKMNFYIDGQKYLAEPGDSWNIPGNIEHSADAIEESIVVEVFSPVREDYLP